MDELLPGWVTTPLNFMAFLCHLLNHFLGFGWGFMAFIALLSFVCNYPGIAYWSRLVQSGMSNDDAIKHSGWVSLPLFALFLLIGGYVYFHGGNVAHPV
jgi:hypothetical protein